jgi:hypothetical protein
MLTRDEIKNLQTHLQYLLEQGDHVHFSSQPDYQKEITFGTYDPVDLVGFSERVRRLIAEDS